MSKDIHSFRVKTPDTLTVHPPGCLALASHTRNVKSSSYRSDAPENIKKHKHDRQIIYIKHKTYPKV